MMLNIIFFNFVLNLMVFVGLFAQHTKDAVDAEFLL